MGSANRVRLAYIEENDYGITPTGDFREVKMISEDLSGTPTTVESAGLRSDRQTSGSVNTGLELSGGFDFEASADTSLQDFIKQAMMSNVVAETSSTSFSGISQGTNNSMVLANAATTGLRVGDLLDLRGFTGRNEGNNQIVQVSRIVTTGTPTVEVVGDGLVAASAAAGSFTRPAYHTIGTNLFSSTISKEFLDVTNSSDIARSIVYTGNRVSELSMSFAFGSIVTGRVSMAGNGYQTPDVPITQGRTVNDAGSDLPLDASNSFGWLLIDSVNEDICLENFDFTLNNNLAAQNCIGKLAPNDQIPGSATVTVSATAFLSIETWELFMPRKIDQVPVSMAFYTRDNNGNGYAVTMDRVQITFPDPAASGRDAQVTLDVTGTASFNEDTGQTMRIYLL